LEKKNLLLGFEHDHFRRNKSTWVAMSSASGSMLAIGRRAAMSGGCPVRVRHAMLL